MKKLTALVLALALVLTATMAFATDIATPSKTVQDRVAVESQGVTAVAEENPEAAVIAEQLAALPEDKKMDIFPETVKETVNAVIATIPEVEDISQLAPVDTFKVELSDLTADAKIKLDGQYGDDVNIIGYIVEFLPETLNIDPLFVLAGDELILPAGVTELVVFAIAKK